MIELSAMNASPKAAGVGQAQPDEVGLEEREPVRTAMSAGATAGTIEHGRVDVDGGHLMTGLGERDREAAAARRELEDRAVGALGQREIEVQVARVVDEVEVVQPREGGRGLGIGRGQHRPAAQSPEASWAAAPPSGPACPRASGRRAR
jgi:hypothetical protein